MGEHIGRGMRRIIKYLKQEDFEIKDSSHHCINGL